MTKQNKKKENCCHKQSGDELLLFYNIKFIKSTKIKKN